MSTSVAEHVPQDLVVDFDVYDQALCADGDKVQERVAELRELGPLVYSTAHGGHWIVTRYEEASAILQDAETFSSYPNFLLGDDMMGKFMPLEIDPPDHKVYRDVLKPFFAPRRMMALEERIRPIVSELIDGFIEAGECDFKEDFAHELPARVFLALIGFDIEDAPQLTEWVNVALNGLPDATAEESQKARMDAAVEAAQYFMKAIEPRRDKAVDEDSDVITALVNTPIQLDEDDEPRLLRDDELIKTLMLVLIAGLHTTEGALCWGVMHLSQQPDKRQALIDDPKGIPAAIEEILRFESPVFPGRRATADTEVAGVQLKEDDQLILALCSVNRDAGQFDAPDELDIARQPNRHLAFSVGRHRCVGAHLARQELRIAFEELHKRLPDYALDGTPQFHPSQVRGCVSMRITFTAGEKQAQ